MKFTDEQRLRYSRQLVLNAVGEDGQEKLAGAKILVIGTGGLGSPGILYLAAAGIGTIGIADGDTVDLSNLQRQILHSTPDVSRPKVDSAGDKITRLNPDVRINKHPLMITADNVMQVIDGYDFIVEATDSFGAKFLINDACVLSGKPFSHAGVLQLGGQTLTILPGRSACLRCVFDSPPPPESVPDAARAGVLGAVAGTLGTLQATEAIKFITGSGQLLHDRILTYDGYHMRFKTLPVQRSRQCRVCGDTPTIVAPGQMP